MSLHIFQNYEASEFFTGKDDHLGKRAIVSIRECYHDTLGRVVVKVFRRWKVQANVVSSPPSEDHDLKTMLREAKKLKMMSHGNIIRFHGVTMWPGFAGIIFELVECGNLESFLRSKELIPYIPWWLRKRILLEIFQALSYLHNYNESTSIVHGSLKSSNILLTKDLVVKLSDMHGVRIQDCNDQYSTCDRFGIDLSEFLQQQKQFDIYSTSLVAYEIITRRVFTSAEFSCFTSLNAPVGLFTRVDFDDDHLNESEKIIFYNLRRVMSDCGKEHGERLDAISAVKSLDGKQNLYESLKRDEARKIAQPIIRTDSVFKQESSLEASFVEKQETSERNYPEPSIGSGLSRAINVPNYLPITHCYAESMLDSKSRHRELYEEETLVDNISSPGLDRKEFPSSNEDVAVCSHFVLGLHEQSEENIKEVDSSDNALITSGRDDIPNTRKRRGTSVKVSSMQRRFPAPEDVWFAFEQCTIVDMEGENIHFDEIEDCEILIPPGALERAHEFKFVLLYLKKNFKNPDVQVLTPTLVCVPSNKFLKNVTAKLPTCYIPEEPVKVTVSFKIKVVRKTGISAQLS
ncbi:uncharacterized protein LOC143452458 isoform X1 [Clavelina lepadiformis]|uniref:uncharacterized protein LOC143452458 isoform X1 n=1 Tax=Clavelina lepadiformis TaxID=159417 RepID=UPI004041FD84